MAFHCFIVWNKVEADTAVCGSGQMNDVAAASLASSSAFSLPLNPLCAGIHTSDTFRRSDSDCIKSLHFSARDDVNLQLLIAFIADWLSVYILM